MNQADFERKIKTEGYGEMVDRRMEPDTVNGDHAHEFDACVMVVEGEMTITRNGAPTTLRVGDLCELKAGTTHSEHAGAAGARYLAGRRYPAHAAS